MHDFSFVPTLSLNHLSQTLRDELENNAGDWGRNIIAAQYDNGYLIQIDPQDEDQFVEWPELQLLRSWAIDIAGRHVRWLEFDAEGPRVDALPYHLQMDALEDLEISLPLGQARSTLVVAKLEGGLQ
ncbi:hypothetical protein HA052_19895 [Chromobacterium haemolyticum]|uniref:DUF5983 domain-containing protein n=1 Tax=Chromobacterium fluminis TaxID=3044269 RepID=A0ABX0LET3_9NEIS|nr:hypothetical protein [Chromobacterium haemolyticum]NHR07458.1 hypothetical protein [Chromobacterium haemolyticum]